MDGRNLIYMCEGETEESCVKQRRIEARWRSLHPAVDVEWL